MDVVDGAADCAAVRDAREAREGDDVSAPQPIQTTAAIVHLRRSAEGLCSRHGGKPAQMPEWLAADLIEWQQRRIKALTEALIEARVAVSDSRIVYAEIAREVGVSHAAEAKALLSDYDELLARIDRAMGMK